MSRRSAVYTILTIAVIVAGLLLIISKPNPPATTGQSDSGQSQKPSAANLLKLSLADYSGRNMTLADYQAKGPVVINAWATWCPFCTSELSTFADAQQEYKDRLTIIAIDRAESRSTAKQFSDQLGISDKLTFLLDPGDAFYRSIGGFTMPETIFVSRSGTLVEHKRGPLTADELSQKLANLVKEP